jgi:hypothetical protein
VYRRGEIEEIETSPPTRVKATLAVAAGIGQERGARRQMETES